MNPVRSPRTQFIEQMAPWTGEEEQRAVAEYLGSGGWLTEFRKAREFEAMVAEYTASQHAIVLSSGTAALFAALTAAGVGEGDEVVVPAFTMIASANSVKLAGATPVLVDVCPRNLCLDLDRVEASITARTKAMMVVSLNGRAPDMRRARELARARRLRLVEDAAQSLGSLHQGKHLGTWGDIGIFSLSPLKIITTGQGGIAVTDDPELAARVRRLKDFGRSRGGTDVYESIGYNFKFTDVQAVIGIEQMRKLPWRVARKKEIFARYASELEGTRGIELIETDLRQTTPSFIDVLAERRDPLRDYLALRGIRTRPFFAPIHVQPAYGSRGAYPAAESAGKRGLWLPSSSFLTDEEIGEICYCIRQFYSK